MSTEKDIWSGAPSHYGSFFYYIFCGVLCFFIFPIFMGLWRYLTIRTWKIAVTNQRVTEQKGVLSRSTDELELFRVKDIKLDEPLWIRIFGLSNIVLHTSDRTSPIVIIPAIKDGKELRETLRDLVDQRREQKGVRETDAVF